VPTNPIRQIANRDPAHVLPLWYAFIKPLLLCAHAHGYIAWGLTMAAYRTGLPIESYWVDLLKYLVGAFILRGSAVTVNDIFDRHVDASVGSYTSSV
jgi:4-hydroxybenzoate polyprenyltransferase